MTTGLSTSLWLRLLIVRHANGPKEYHHDSYCCHVAADEKECFVYKISLSYRISAPLSKFQHVRMNYRDYLLTFLSDFNVLKQPKWLSK